MIELLSLFGTEYPKTRKDTVFYMHLLSYWKPSTIYRWLKSWQQNYIQVTVWYEEQPKIQK